MSLGTLFFAAQFLDLIWPILLLLDYEHVSIMPGYTAFTPLNFYDYPISHSLAAAAVWGLVVMYLSRRMGVRDDDSWILAGCVVSHWVLDFIAHGPDMPISPGLPDKFGLGLWNSVTGTVAVELAMFAGAVLLFLSVSKAKDTIGSVAFWAFIIFVLVLYAGNVVGGPPNDVHSLAWFGLAQWLMVPWAYWVDHLRDSTGPPRTLSVAA